MISTTVTSRGHQVPCAQYFLTSLRTKPEALLRLFRQPWSFENEWHWPRDTHLHMEEVHCPLLHQSQRSAANFVPARGGHVDTAARPQYLLHNGGNR